MATYIVVKGDTFDEIAKRLGCSDADLQKSNPGIKNPAEITPGEKINVPGDAKNTTYHVKSGDTGNSIAKNDDTTFAELKKLNPDVVWTNLQIGSTLIVPRD